MTNDDFEAGLKAGREQGRMDAMEKNQRAHADWLKHLDKRMQIQERITYGLLGTVAFIEFLPSIKAMFNGGG